MLFKCEICNEELPFDEAIGFIHELEWHGFCSENCREIYRHENKC